MTANTPGILDYLHEFKREVADGHDIFTVAEANGVSADELQYWVGQDGAFDMLFEFSHVNLEFKGIETWCRPDPWELKDLKKALVNSQTATKDNGWYPIFFENHDKPRCVDHFFKAGTDPKKAAKVIGMVLYTLRGTPFLFQGQELGLGNVKWPSIDCYNDISSYGQYDFAIQEGFSEAEAIACVHAFSRDSARTPMQWNDEENAGFTKGKPWLPVHDDYAVMNVEAEEKDPDSVLNWYRQLAAIRQEETVLTEGNFSELMKESNEVFAYARSKGDQKAVILANFSDNEVTVDPDLIKNMQVKISSVKDHTEGVLAPLEAVLYISC